MDNQKKKTPPRKISRISQNNIETNDTKNAFVGVLNGKVAFIQVNNGGEFDLDSEESVDGIIECDTYTITDEKSYERKFGKQTRRN